jgi:hypothetical protein
MSQTYFSKMSSQEKQSRLTQLGQSKGTITVWVKGQKQKHQFSVLEYDAERSALILNSKHDIFRIHTPLLCSFELRGMYFFMQVDSNKNILDQFILECSGELFKSEKRNSYRLLTFPIYEVYAEFKLDESYEGGNVIDIKNRASQTGLFKNFLKLVDPKENEGHSQSVKHRIQDLSTTGMSFHIGELDSQFFFKDAIFKDILIHFSDESILIPEVKVVYVVDYVSGDKKLKKLKVGIHFPHLATSVDEKIGKKINQLLRQIDFNKDFETFTK